MIRIGKLDPGNIRGRDIGHSFVNRTIKLWNQLPARALATFPCRAHIFKKRVMKVVISEVK
jgi:hypothetical protein